jgi:hypothetical protein
MLSARPARSRHVRALSIFPDCSPLSSPTSSPHSSLSLAEESVGRQRTSRWGRGVLADGYAVSSAVRRAARRFEVLSCFVWDGEELPPYDDMWFALRISCVSPPTSLFSWIFIAACFVLYRFFIIQLPAPQVHLDDAWIYPTFTKQPCACVHFSQPNRRQTTAPLFSSYSISPTSTGSR